jgi:hypothetical protein
MICHGSYYGDKADVWSIGCILLELVLGHERFCDIWMIAYDYDILQNKEQFTVTISETVEQLPDLLRFSDDLNDFVLRFLEMRPVKRPSIRSLAVHPWLNGIMDDAISGGSSLAARLNGGEGNGKSFSPPVSPCGSFSMDANDTFLSPNSSYKDGSCTPTTTSSSGTSSGGYVSQEVLKQAYNNLSEKERRQMEEYILQRKNGNGLGVDNNIKLPPIMPATPNIGHAKKILRKGNELASRSYGPSSESQAFFMQEIPSSPLTPIQLQPQQQQLLQHQESSSLRSHSPAGRSPLPSLSESLNELDGGGNDSKNSTGNLGSLSFSPRRINQNGNNDDNQKHPSAIMLLSSSESQIFHDLNSPNKHK